MARKPKQVEGVYERPEGSGIWYVRYRVNGKRVRKSFGRDRARAVEYIEKTRTVLRTGEGVVPATAKRHTRTVAELQVLGGTVTVSELCDDFLAHVLSHPEEFRDSTNPPRRIAAIRRAFGERAADSVKKHEIATWLGSLKKRTRGIRNGVSRQTNEPISAATSNRLKSTFSSIYRLASLNEKVADEYNPARNLKQRPVGGGVIRFMSPLEETRLREVLLAKVSACHLGQPLLRQQALHRIYELDVALGTGMRMGEQYGMRWADVDFDREVITLRDTKNGSAREVHMITDVVTAMTELRKMRDDSDPVRPGYVFRNSNNKKWWLAALREAKIVNLRWHDLRHTFCSRLAQSGANLKVIQEAAGHKTIQMSARYAHLDKTSLAKAMAVLNRSTA